MYRVWCRFEKDYVNPLTGRVGRWRVILSLKCAPDYWQVRLKTFGRLSIPSTKPYKHGSIIRPHKELNKVLAAR